MFSPLEQFDVYIWTFFFLPVTNLLIPLVTLLIIYYFIYIYLSENLKLIPSTFQTLVEKSIIFIFNLVTSQIGKLGYIYIPLVCCLFNFILGLNILSLLPFGLAVTSHIIIIIWIALSICSGIFLMGISHHNIKFLYIFIPQCPVALLPLLMVIEIFSYIIRAFSLAIRLSANIMAGHTLVHIIGSFVFLIGIKILGAVLGITFLFAILGLELGVAFLQAYVFSVLVCIYLSDAIKGGEEH